MNLFSKSNLTLLNKIMVAFVAYIIVILMVFSSIVLLIDRGEVKGVADSYSQAITKSNSRLIEAWVNERVSDVQMLSITDEVKSLDETSIEFLNEILESQNDVYIRYFVIDKEGNMMDTLGINKRLTDDQDFDRAVANKEAVVVSDVVDDTTFVQPTFRVLVPVLDNDEIIGVIGSTVLIYNMSDYISEDTINDNGYIWIIDNSGNVISHIDQKQILNLNLTTADEEGYNGLTALGEMISENSSGFGDFENLDGEREYVRYEPIYGTPGWTVISTIYASSIFATVSNLMTSMIILFAIIIAISIVVSYFLAKDVTKPIETLIEVTKKFTTGVKGIRARIESKDEIGELAQSFNAMADTIVAHTDNLEELIKERTQVLADLNYQIVSRNKELGTMNEELEKTNNKLHELASTDMLTGLYNRHQFQRDLQKTIELVNVGDEQNFSLLFIDLDNFKHYNDTFSHEIGDFLLQEVAQILQANVRENDLVGRYGGDEFVIMLRQGNYDIAKAIAERIHAAILGRDGFKKELSRKLNGEVKIMGKNKLSSSIGIVNYMKSMGINNAEDLLAKADETMYKAKKAGKSRVVVD